MQNELTYIGPESQGPHYLESGKRPLLGEYESAHVIAQEANGDVLAVHYDGTNDRFSTYVADNTVRPVCWWHLPAAAPSTEREWFHCQFKCDEDGYFEYKGYSTKLHIDFDLRHKGVLLGGFAHLKEATGAAYQHWVEAGRP